SLLQTAAQPPGAAIVTRRQEPPVAAIVTRRQEPPVAERSVLRRYVSTGAQPPLAVMTRSPPTSVAPKGRIRSDWAVQAIFQHPARARRVTSNVLWFMSPAGCQSNAR